MKPCFRHLLFLSAICATAEVRAADLTNGVMSAVPLKGGQAPAIDGNLNDFDLSGTEPIWLSAPTIEQYNSDIALMYDDEALYFGLRMALPDRAIRNPNNPTDAFWSGDVLELRLAADPSLSAPLDNNINSDRVAHVTIWKNSETDKDYLNITYGVNLEKGAKVNPAGSQVVIKQHGQKSYTVEARIPWSAFNVTGGKNPFKVG